MVRPVPRAAAREIVELVAYLYAHGGQQTLSHIASDIHREVSHIRSMADGAEILNLVQQKNDAVQLSIDGARFAKALARWAAGTCGASECWGSTSSSTSSMRSPGRNSIASDAASFSSSSQSIFRAKTTMPCSIRSSTGRATSISSPTMKRR